MFNEIDFNMLFDNKRKETTFERISEELIKNTEERINHKLPISFIEFLKKQNGGFINNDIFAEESYKYVDIIFGISNDHKSYTIENEYKNSIGNDYPDYLVPFAMDESGGHVYYYFDYRHCNNNEPIIVRIDDEEFFTTSNQKDENKIYFVADNFKEFINKVYKDPSFFEQRSTSIIEKYKTKEERKQEEKNKKKDLEDTIKHYKKTLIICIILTLIIIILSILLPKSIILILFIGGWLPLIGIPISISEIVKSNKELNK